ncbi:DUF4167 domain-containing protein [Magnetospira sp. QH-2]|uniref:DUF4167 domain-containing protein n=1 Tax=Magnetospira sp. (strain QH-2) TaxID=1288970 RepID=UPI00208E4C35|nr:DUF4167 domain-containing protein [Magnetospira sp. QH-2]
MNKGTNNNKRPRTRNGKRHSGNKNHTYDSNGPEVRVRGTAHQVLEKYLSLARDASSVGDRISAEAYYQHAEHYYRIINAQAENSQNRQPRTPGGDRQMVDPIPNEGDGAPKQDAQAPSEPDAEEAKAAETPAEDGGDEDGKTEASAA